MTQSPPARPYTVLALDPPLSPARLAACKSLRLSSLQLDPHGFVSNYAREAAFTEDVWRQRFDSPLSRTMVVSANASALDGSPPGSSESSADAPAEAKTETGGEWVGTATVVCPLGIPPAILAPFKTAGVGADWEIYALYAMWVHPAHRGRGVGVQLVEVCLDWVRAHIGDPATLSSADRQKVLALLVYDDNVAGRALYSRTGFADLKGVVSAEEGQRWMVFKL